MRGVHKTACVAAGAELGDGVTVGAFTIIENGVRIGARTQIGPHVVIRAGAAIGDDNRIFQFASIGDEPQHLNYAGAPTTLTIGARNIIREYCSIHRGSGVGGAGAGDSAAGGSVIGDDNFFMAYTHIAHDCVVGDCAVFANGASLAGHVTVGDYAVLGGFTLVHQFCRIGAHCITAIGAGCLQDVPPFVVAAGNPAAPFGVNTKGLRRRGFSAESIANLKKSYRLLYREKLELHAAVAAIENLRGDEHMKLLCDFLRGGRRGIIR